MLRAALIGLLGASGARVGNTPVLPGVNSDRPVESDYSWLPTEFRSDPRPGGEPWQPGMPLFKALQLSEVKNETVSPDTCKAYITEFCDRPTVLGADEGSDDSALKIEKEGVCAQFRSRKKEARFVSVDTLNPVVKRPVDSKDMEHMFAMRDRIFSALVKAKQLVSTRASGVAPCVFRQTPKVVEAGRLECMFHKVEFPIVFEVMEKENPVFARVLRDELDFVKENHGSVPDHILVEIVPYGVTATAGPHIHSVIDGVVDDVFVLRIHPGPRGTTELLNRPPEIAAVIETDNQYPLFIPCDRPFSSLEDSFAGQEPGFVYFNGRDPHRGPASPLNEQCMVEDRAITPHKAGRMGFVMLEEGDEEHYLPQLGGIMKVTGVWNFPGIRYVPTMVEGGG